MRGLLARTMVALVAVVGITWMTVASATPAAAATEHPATTTAGSIVCTWDVCIQTQGVSVQYGYAIVKAWAYLDPFYGHFEMAHPSTNWAANSPQRTWYAGGQGWYFYVPLYCYSQYVATAWNYVNGHYDRLGQVAFSIHC